MSLPFGLASARARAAASTQRTCLTFLPLLLVPSLAVGCNLAEGLTDVAGSLGNPDAALISHPGRQVAQGAFHGLVIDGSMDDGGQVIALERTEEGTRLAVIPYLEGDPCYVAPVDDFSRLSSRVNVDLPGVLAVQKVGEDGEPGTISFVDFKCNELFSPIAGNSLPRTAFPSSQPRGLLSLDAKGTLFLIEPAEDELTKVAEHVSVARVVADRLWSIEDGVLKVRSRTLAVEATMGQDVAEFVVTGGDDLAVAFRDSEGVWVWSEASDAQLISKDGCNLVAEGPNAIGYFEPCDSQNVALYASGSVLALNAPFVKLTGPTMVPHTLAFSITWGNTSKPTQLLYLKGKPDEWTGDLTLAELELDPDDSDEASSDEIPHYSFSSEEELASEVTLVDGQYYQDYEYIQTDDEKVGSGTLMELVRDDQGAIVGFSKVASNVVQIPGPDPFSPRGILTDWKDGTGTLRFLRRVGEKIESRVLATGVPKQGQTVEPETGRTAFMGDVEERGLGTLYLTSGTNPKQQDLLEISDRILVDTARFLTDPHAVAYLYLSKDGSASLRTWLIDAELEINIHPRVSEYRTVPWPAPGILYAVPDGKDQGLWYAKAR